MDAGAECRRECRRSTYPPGLMKAGLRNSVRFLGRDLARVILRLRGRCDVSDGMGKRQRASGKTRLQKSRSPLSPMREGAHVCIPRPALVRLPWFRCQTRTAAGRRRGGIRAPVVPFLVGLCRRDRTQGKHGASSACLVFSGCWPFAGMLPEGGTWCLPVGKTGGKRKGVISSSLITP